MILFSMLATSFYSVSSTVLQETPYFTKKEGKQLLNTLVNEGTCGLSIALLGSQASLCICQGGFICHHHPAFPVSGGLGNLKHFDLQMENLIRRWLKEKTNKDSQVFTVPISQRLFLLGHFEASLLCQEYSEAREISVALSAKPDTAQQAADNST